jgi:hypothetical protein
MSFVKRPASWAVLALLCGALFGAGATPASAANYQMVLCAANNGSNGFATATNTTSPQNPGGIFSFENYCGPAPFPAGNSAFLRIDENQAGGNAGVNAYGAMSWTPPPWIAIIGGGGYTRMPNAFNDGWRGRFWVEGWDGSTNNILVQGNGVANGDCGGVCWASCSAFCSHLWPFGGYGDYRRFIFEMTCFRSAGCDRTNFNAVDANTIILTLSDRFDSQIGWTGSSPFMSGQWTRGGQTSSFVWNEIGSGIRMEWIDIDGNRRWTIDHVATGECNRDFWGGVGEFARDFSPCAQATGIGRAYGFDTASLGDGAHNMTPCTQDYSQWFSGTGSCIDKTIFTDNTAPAAPVGLQAITPDTVRYYDHFDAKFSLPANAGSPITKVHYRVVDSAGTVVAPEQVLSGVNPTEVKNIAGPVAQGDYKLQVWLEDQVGFAGPVASVPLPRDVTPPAAPQDVSVTVPTTSRAADGFDVRWHNIVDAGSPINAAYYQVLSGSGEVLVATQTLKGDNPQAIQDLLTPGDRGDYALRIWLSDAEGNVGAPATVPLSYSCVRSAAAGGNKVTSGMGPDASADQIVRQGEASVFAGTLSGGGGAVGSAPLCIFSRVSTDPEREFLGLAISSKDGSYRFPVTPGPSRHFTAIYRSDHREVSSTSEIQTIVHPTFRAKKRVVLNKHFARFYGEIPGPHNDRVVVVLQVKSGKGWLAFRRYRTRNGGKFVLGYRFNRTIRPTKYVMRAQVRQTTGYPYLQGNSDRLPLKVVPRQASR